MKFDTRFLIGLPFIFTRQIFDECVIRTYGIFIDGDVISGYSFKPLPEHFIGARITVDESNLLHSFNDQPAAVLPGQFMFWYKHGQLYRNRDLPVVVLHDSEFFWYKNNKCHREKGPSYLDVKEGRARYFVNDILHRKNRPAFIDDDGVAPWCENDRLIKTVSFNGELYFENQF